MPDAPAPTLSAAILPALLELLPSGVVSYIPIYDAAGAVVDFHFAYLNPAAQRILRLAARPTTSYTEQFPASITNGGLAFHCQAYQHGEPSYFELNYQADGYDNYFRVAARRAGDELLVTFTDTSDQPRTAVEEALRQSQAREREAQQALERERNVLQAVLAQAPVGIGVFQGEELVVATANDELCGMWGHPPAQIIGQPLLEGVPELRGQGFEKLIQEVARTRVPFIGREAPAKLAENGELRTHYYNFIYQPFANAVGELLGVMVIANNVTEQVISRLQVQSMNEELAAINEELRASNEEHLQANVELAEAQQELRALNEELHAFNQDLEARVNERTHEVQRARAEAERQRWRFERLVMDAPMAICVFDGPSWIYELVNPRYQQMFPGRKLQGLRLVEALPEVADQPLMEILHRVYNTGATFESPELLVPLARTADGPIENIYFDLTYQARYNEQNHIDGFITFANDVTEQVLARRRIEEQERETSFLNEELQVANEEIRSNNDELTHAQLALRQLNDELEARVHLRTYEVEAARTQAEARQEDLRQLFNQAPVAIALMQGPQHVVELINEPNATLLGSTVAHLLGQPIFEALPALRNQGFEQVLKRAWRGERIAFEEVAVTLNRAHTGQPDQGYFHVTYQPWRSERGEIMGVIAVTVEVTEQVLARRLVEEKERETSRLNAELQVANEEIKANNYALEHTQAQLRELNGALEGRVLRRTQELTNTIRQLTRTNADLDNFIYTASHDLKAPISNIEGLLNLLHELLPESVRTEAEVAPVLGLMQGAVERFTRTIGHLTEVSKLQAEFAQPAAPVLLAAVVEDVRQDLLPLLTEAGAELEVEVDECQPRVFSEKNLRSVIYNLLSNAIKYRAFDRAPWVRIACQTEDQHLLLTVQDNGLGLSEQQQTRLFQLFQRLHTHVEGTGLGLYMVKSIVENAGGTLAVQSQLGVGTTFTLLFPA